MPRMSIRSVIRAARTLRGRSAARTGVFEERGRQARDNNDADDEFHPFQKMPQATFLIPKVDFVSSEHYTVTLRSSSQGAPFGFRLHECLTGENEKPFFGALVTAVQKSSAADLANIKVNDVLWKVNGEGGQFGSLIAAIMQARSGGGPLILSFKRGTLEPILVVENAPILVVENAP